MTDEENDIETGLSIPGELVKLRGSVDAVKVSVDATTVEARSANRRLSRWITIVGVGLACAVGLGVRIEVVNHDDKVRACEQANAGRLELRQAFDTVLVQVVANSKDKTQAAQFQSLVDSNLARAFPQRSC